MARWWRVDCWCLGVGWIILESLGTVTAGWEGRPNAGQWKYAPIGCHRSGTYIHEIYLDYYGEVHDY
jgi:hypothetical protein